MKQLPLLFLLFIGFAAFSQNANSLVVREENDISKRSLIKKNGIKVSKEYFQSTSAEPKRINSKRFYDANGFLVKTIYYQKGDSAQVVRFFYNKQGLLSQSKIWSKRNNETLEENFEYNAKGFLTKYYNGKAVQLYEYDSLDVLVKNSFSSKEMNFQTNYQTVPGDTLVNATTLVESKDSPQTLVKTHLFHNDKISEVNEYEGEKLVSKTTYLYDETGRLITKSQKDFPYPASMSYYVYDDKGLLISTSMSNGAYLICEYEK